MLKWIGSWFQRKPTKKKRKYPLNDMPLAAFVYGKSKIPKSIRYLHKKDRRFLAEQLRKGNVVELEIEWGDDGYTRFKTLVLENEEKIPPNA